MTQFKYEYLAKGSLLKFKSMKVYAVNFETILQSKCVSYVVKYQLNRHFQFKDGYLTK